jgi:CIC family chloride channel protein
LKTGTEEYVGMLDVAGAREILLDPELVHVMLVGTIMSRNYPPISVDTSLHDTLELFESAGVWVLPVVDGDRFVGLLSKSSLFDHYRRELNAQVPG